MMEVVHATEQAAFGDRVQPLLPAAYRLAYGMLHSPHEAEDAVQESLLKAWRAQGRLRPGSDFDPSTFVADGDRLWAVNAGGSAVWLWTRKDGLERFPLHVTRRASTTYWAAGPCA